METPYDSRIAGAINAEEVHIGKGVVVEEGVIITGKGGPAKRVVLGDFCFIGQQTKIIVPEFRLGDYSKLYQSSLVHGERPMQIARNCWIGGNTVLDSLGGLDIDDNVASGHIARSGHIFSSATSWKVADFTLGNTCTSARMPGLWATVSFLPSGLVSAV